MHHSTSRRDLLYTTKIGQAERIDFRKSRCEWFCEGFQFLCRLDFAERGFPRSPRYNSLNEGLKSRPAFVTYSGRDLKTGFEEP